jgi:hypothetical protein
MPIVQNLMKKAKGQLTVQRGKLNVAIALGKKIPQSPGRFIVYLFNLVGIPSQLSGKDYDKVKIPTRQWESLMENDLLSRLDTAISHRFSHLCRQIQQGNLHLILASSSKDTSITLKPKQDKAEDVIEKSLMSLVNLDKLVQSSDSAISPELPTVDNELPISEEILDIDIEGNDYDLNDPLEGLTEESITPDDDEISAHSFSVTSFGKELTLELSTVLMQFQKE